jgi:PBP1b-binding outer membrane lipoprotein LpoB
MFKGFLLGLLTSLALVLSSCSSMLSNDEYKDLPNHDHIECIGKCDIKLK